MANPTELTPLPPAPLFLLIVSSSACHVLCAAHSLLVRCPTQGLLVVCRASLHTDPPASPPVAASRVTATSSGSPAHSFPPTHRHENERNTFRPVAAWLLSFCTDAGASMKVFLHQTRCGTSVHWNSTHAYFVQGLRWPTRVALNSQPPDVGKQNGRVARNVLQAMPASDPVDIACLKLGTLPLCERLHAKRRW
jgi:hypothetical protein